MRLMTQRLNQVLTRRELVTLLAAAALPLRQQTASPIIRTVLRDVNPTEIDGPILIHEHLSLGGTDWGIERPASKWYDDVDLIASEVAACKPSGVRCIVDMGTSDLGRKIGALRTIATRSNMHIVAGGGLHAKSDYPPDTLRKTSDQIADDFYRLATAERWGVIGEIGTGTGVPMDPGERTAMIAAAKLHLRTGLAIVTHTSDGCARCALDQVDLFESAGVSLDRVVIGHLNDIKEQPAAAPMAIAKRGAYVAFDHSGKPDDPRADEYVKTILTLLEAGLANRICLSADFASERFLRKKGGPGIDMTITNFVPRLRRAGVDDATLRTILIENPRRVLTFVPRDRG
jgi:predicted metal-dependent phosphotriesterase family hydrolase